MRMINSTLNTLYWLAILVWSSLCIYVFVCHLMIPQAEIDGEVTALFYGKMLILTFPLGYFAGILVGLMLDAASTLGLDPSLQIYKVASTILTWLSMTLVGGLQWFVVLPLFIKKVVSKIKNGDQQEIGPE